MTRFRWVPLTFLSALLAVGGTAHLFSTFMAYDDEGYVLYSLQTFATVGGLYEKVFSQYGPFFFLFNQGLHFAGLDFTNTTARLVTLGCWLGAAGFCGALLWRLTRSSVAAGFALGGVLLHLWQMRSEPSHPGGLIVLAIAAAAWCGSHWATAPRPLALAIGLIGAALVLTKINVGIFLLAGAGVWWLLHLEAPTFGLRTRSALAAFAMALWPVALMRSQFANHAVVIFAAVTALAGASVSIAAARGARPLSRWRDLPVLAIAGLVVTAVTVLAMISQGSSLRSLLEGVLLGPLRHPAVYSVNVDWPASTVAVAVGLAAAAAGAIAWPGVLVTRWVAFARLAAVAVYFAFWVFGEPESILRFTLCFGLGLAWLFVFPLGGDEATQPARAWLALLLVPQALHAFPVAGSQVGWGTFLWVPLAALGTHDAIQFFSSTWRPAVTRMIGVAGGFVLLIVTLRGGEYAWRGLSRVQQSESLSLPGAAALQLPGRTTTALRILSRNITVHADTLFSLPGMLSFHRWTDVPPPTTVNATHWFSLLSTAQQESIRQKLADSPRAVVVVQREVYDFLTRTGVDTSSPLNTWLHDHYEAAFTLESYELWVRKGRTIAALDTATLFEAAADNRESRFKISLTLAAAALETTTALELHRLNVSIGTSERTWNPANARLFVTPLNAAGVTMGVPQQITLPFRSTGILRLDVFTDDFPEKFPPKLGVIYLRDAHGQHTAEARFIN